MSEPRMSMDQGLETRLSMTDADIDTPPLTNTQRYALDQLLPMVGPNLGPVEFLARLNHDKVVTAVKPLPRQDDKRCDQCRESNNGYCMITLNRCLTCEAHDYRCTFTRGERVTWPACRYKTLQDKYPIPYHFNLENPEIKSFFKRLDQAVLLDTRRLLSNTMETVTTPFLRMGDTATSAAPQLAFRIRPAEPSRNSRSGNDNFGGNFNDASSTARETVTAGRRSAAGEFQTDTEKFREAGRSMLEAMEALGPRMEQLSLQAAEIASLKQELHHQEQQKNQLRDMIRRLRGD